MQGPKCHRVSPPPPLSCALGLAPLQQWAGEDPLNPDTHTPLPCALGLAPLQQWAGEEEVLVQLLLIGAYDEAISLAHACWEGAALTRALERTVGALASQCVRLQTQEDGERHGRGGGCAAADTGRR